MSRHDGVRIEERAEVRVRIVGVRIDAAELVSGLGIRVIWVIWATGLFL